MSVDTKELLSHCLSCGYSLEGHPVQGHCPKCGRPFDKTIGVWRNDDELAFLKGVPLPRQCIQCGSSAEYLQQFPE